MFTLLKNVNIYAPKALGVQDILIAGQTIAAIGKLSDITGLPDCLTKDLEGQILVPGLIDQHVHLIGGGGEAGFTSRTPEIQISQIVRHGVTSVLGLIGTDCDTRHPATLNAKTRALNDEGISAWMLTGGYTVPSPTITGSVRNDILYAERCIGLKIALSDHRAPHVSYDEWTRLASDCRIAGMLAGKAGTITLHLGNAPQHLDLLFRTKKETAIPVQQFIPTHVNRDQGLYSEALKWASLGGRIDITAGIKTGQQVVPPVDAITEAREANIPESAIAVSSDAQGSMPVFDTQGKITGIGVAQQDGLLKIVQEQVAAGYDLSIALQPVTNTPANWLKLPNKGAIKTGHDADFLLLNDNLELSETWAKGKCLFSQGQSQVHGLFE